MQRSAIIIGSPANINYLSGVKKDASEWKSFLMSGQGGAWSDKEITVMLDADKGEIVSEIKKAKISDYALIAFSGHGYIRKDDLGFNETFLVIKDNVDISERQLNPGNDRCMVIIDCCRKAPDEFLIESTAKVRNFFEFNNLGRLRKLYDEAIIKSEKGCTKIYAADIGQAASDDASFTQYLIAVSRRWAMDECGILNIDKAMDLVVQKMKNTNPQQVPVYRGGRRLHHLPFSVN